MQQAEADCLLGSRIKGSTPWSVTISPMAAYTGVSKLGARSFDLLKLKHLRGYLPGTKIWGTPIEKNIVSICFHVIPTCQHFYLQLLTHLRRWSRANFASARVPGWTGHFSYIGVSWYRRYHYFESRGIWVEYSSTSWPSFEVKNDWTGLMIPFI